MKNKKVGIWSLALCLCGGTMSAWSQDSNSPAAPTAAASTVPVSGAAEPAQVPRLVRFSGTLLDDAGKPRTGVAGITFLLYKDQEGGAPLWLETQNVNLDARGRYSVLLGAGKADGLPTELFASSEARWLAAKADGGPEQPRVLLLSVPYALKAADAETLGGRPASDYVLSKAEPGNSTAATASTAPASSSSNSQNSSAVAPVNGTGIKNFIPIWTSTTSIGDSTIFENGGKVGIGTGTITPLNTLQVAAPNQLGLLVQGPVTGVGSGIDLQTSGTGGKGWEILATGKTSAQGLGKFNIRDLSTGQDRLTIATSGIGIGTTTPGFSLDVNGNTNVSGSLFGHFAEFTGTVNNPTLVVNQTGTGGAMSVRSGASGSGISIQSAGSNAIGLSADTTNGGTVAVLGTNETDAKFANAIQGQANGGTQETIGVWGSSQSRAGIGTLGDQGQSGIFHTFEGVVGAGVWGDTNGAAGNHAGVVGTSDDGIGVGAHTQGNDAAALYVQNDTATTTSLLFDAIGASVGGECFIDVKGNLHCTGQVTGLVSVQNGTKKAELYAVESPENWFEDFGSGHLSGGAATITIDAAFADAANTSVDYHVFLTPTGECKGLYVSQKAPGSFEVRELGGGASSIAFDYRIVAHRRGQEQVRMADMTAEMNSHTRWVARNKP